MDRSGRVFFLIILAVIGAWAVSELLRLKALGGEEWTQVGYALLCLSVVTGFSFARITISERASYGPFLIGGLVQAIFALFIVAVLMGGASAWTLAFWLLTAIGWAPACAWVFSVDLVSYGLIQRVRHG